MTCACSNTFPCQVPVSAAACNGVAKGWFTPTTMGRWQSHSLTSLSLFPQAAGSSGSSGSAAESNAAVAAALADESLNKSVAALVDTIKSRVKLPKRHPDGTFYFAIDHCFAIKGQVRVHHATLCLSSSPVPPLTLVAAVPPHTHTQGTVMTGTVLGGSVKLNQVQPRSWCHSVVTLHLTPHTRYAR